MTWVDTTRMESQYEERRDSITGVAQHRRRGEQEWQEGAEPPAVKTIEGTARRVDETKRLK